MRSLDIRKSLFAIAATLFACFCVVSPAGAAEPVGITAIDVRSRIATAEPEHGARPIQFKVSNAALLRTLKVGQTVYADLRTGKVALDPDAAEPVGAILRTQTAAPDGDSGTQATGQAMQTGDEFGRGGLPPRKVTMNAPPNCPTCAGDCKKCTDAGQDCNCTQVSTGSSPGPEDDIVHCTCSGAEPRPVGRNR